MRRVPTFTFYLLPFTLRGRARARARGQALLIAVLVLFAVATLAALFTALIGSQLAQVSRQSNMVALRNVAEAGLRLANEQLAYAPEGADWRPSRSPYQCGEGQASLTVSYGPSPDQVQSRFLRIVSTAVFPDNPFLRHTIVAVKPVLLTDYAWFITDRYENNQPAALGVTGLEGWGGSRTDYVTSIEGPIRSNTDLEWRGKSQVSLQTTFDTGTDWSELKVLRDDKLEVAGQMQPARRWNTTLQQWETEPDCSLSLLIDGISRASNLFAPANPTEDSDYATGFGRTSAGAIIANSETVLADLPELLSVSGSRVSALLQVPRIRPPLLDAVHPDKDQNRYLLLTRDAGSWGQTTSGAWYNSGEHGWGWTNFGGIYLDNGPYVDAAGWQPGEIQYNHDQRLLQMNWLRSLGMYEPGGDARNDASPTAPADWWDTTARYYAPPGAEIILHGEATCPYVEVIRHDVKAVSGQYYYWRKPNGDPILVTTTEPQKMNLRADDGYVPANHGCDPTLAPGSLADFGIYDGNRAIFPFPPNGVIYAEGNVRVRGVLPAVVGSPRYYREGNQDRRYDLQIVSGGTIYVEGDILSPARAGLVGAGLTGSDLIAADRDQGTRLALLARDSVCVNTTALNPRPENLYKIVGTQRYNDAQPVYTSSGNEGYLLFEGLAEAEVSQDPVVPPVATNPALINMIYTNSRLSAMSSATIRTALSPGLASLHLVLGHSGLYAPIGSPPKEPPIGTTGSPPDDPWVEVALSHNATLLNWAFGGSAYQFVREAVADPTTRDESKHWYTDIDPTSVAFPPAVGDDWLELLPNNYQAMLLQSAAPSAMTLTGEDTFTFTSRVSPVRLYDADLGAYTGWQIPPKDLAYVLGPVAVAPLNRYGGNPVAPLPVEIDALMYAQNGCWFVIPGRWFNDDPDTAPDPVGTPPTSPYPGYHEPLNIKISVYGAISENMPADSGAVAEWTSKWSGPAGQGAAGFLSYRYDPLLRYPRSEWRRGLHLRFPNFPLTSDLVIWGERVTGPAGI